MMRFFLLIFSFFACVKLSSQDRLSNILIHISDKDYNRQSTLIAVNRISEYAGALTSVDYDLKPRTNNAGYACILLLGLASDSDFSQISECSTLISDDSYFIKTLTKHPLKIAVAGKSERSKIYAAYHLADLLKAKADLSNLNLFFNPKIKERYVSFGATTHGRRYYRPDLHYKSLNELPRYRFNGVIIYPGGGTPIGRKSSPILESEKGELYTDKGNTDAWKKWFSDIKTYGMDIMMTIPPLVPPGYADAKINEFYQGGPEPKDYLKNLQTQFRSFLEMLTIEYPGIDRFMFNSTEGATFGNNKRFFNHPAPDKFSIENYNANNVKIMQSYFDVLVDFFREDINKVAFWTHSFGLTSDGLRKMREVLFQYPKVMIIEDDYWNNNLWPFSLPAMAYLPPDLREDISEKNPFALFQIATDGEYYGGGSLPTAYPGSHIKSANEAISRKADMVIQRLDLHDRTSYGTAFGIMEIVPFAASAQLWSPTPSQDEIWEMWAERRFGKSAAPFVIRALKESQNITLKGFSGNGIDLIGVGSEFNPGLWTTGTQLSRFHLFSRPDRKVVPKIWKDAITSSEYTSYQMNTHTIPIQTFRSHQASAFQSVKRGQAEIEEAKPFLLDDDYLMLKEIYKNGEYVLKAISLLGEAAYATNLMADNFDKVPSPVVLHQKAVSNLENFLAEGKLIPEMTANLYKIAKDYKDFKQNRKINNEN